MNLDERKLKILETIINEYILSASPVGSRAVSRNAEFNLSSATIRNEMADLEEMGFLEQPHTSAGRIPSDKAYRLYVDSMMTKSMNQAQLTEDEINAIRDYFDGRTGEVGEVLRRTAHAISSVTHYTAVVLPPEMGGDVLKHIQLVPLMPGRALVVVVTGTGYAKDAVIRVSYDMTASDLESVSHLLTERLKGCRMDEVPARIRRIVNGELNERRRFLETLTDTIERKIMPESRDIELSGTVNMLHFPEYSDLDKARSFLSAVEGRDAIYTMLRNTNRVEFTVTIGRENEPESLKECSIVTATYRIGDLPVGTLGVIGPTRMNYSKVISVLEYMRRSLGEVLTNYMEEEH